MNYVKLDLERYEQLRVKEKDLDFLRGSQDNTVIYWMNDDYNHARHEFTSKNKDKLKEILDKIKADSNENYEIKANSFINDLKSDIKNYERQVSFLKELRNQEAKSIIQIIKDKIFK